MGVHPRLSGLACQTARMPLLLRLALVWLLALAVPLQAMATVVMLGCCPASDSGSAAVATGLSAQAEAAPAAAAGEHAQMAMAGSMSMVHAAMTLPEAAASAIPTSSHDHEAAGGDASHCGACALCAVGPLAPTMSLVTASLPVTTRLAPSTVRVDPVFLTDGPERPPRTHLA
jgi:hypothetical protein